MMLLRDNTSRYLYILLASSIIKIELKKCVVHKIGRMRLHLRPEKNTEKVNHLSHLLPTRNTKGWRITRGGEGLSKFSEQELFSALSKARFFLNSLHLFLLREALSTIVMVAFSYTVRSVMRLPANEKPMSENQ